MKAAADLRPALEQGLSALGLKLQEAQCEQLMSYLDLIGKWNRVYNLTAVREPGQMLTHHLLDCLAALSPLHRHLTQAARAEGRLLDVGSGAGLPGIVFALGCPDLQVSCVDTVGKKAAFIAQAAASLALKNLAGVHARVESLTGPFDVISSRAFATLADFVAGSRQALAPGGIWLAMKGRHPASEMAALPADVDVFHVEPLVVPGLDAERCIVWMRLR
ncbi:MAG: 16S rRNA (guanine(527)-N(7))-methyltransferase RsmG [Comamonadaceae bacterium]|jgi:16S rRNA (guanine527-N7)-methyltransferase|nr:16S rRNA (guanine(527)-N(7))-methyltransferase RsmG [Comamonadaceae bacterium]